MSKDLENHIARLVELSDVKEDVLAAQSDITIIMLGNLLIKLCSSIDDALEGAINKEAFDKELGQTIKASIETAIVEFAKQKPPEIRFEPNINTVDLQPLISLVREFSNTNNSILSVLGSISKENKKEDGGESDKLYPIIVQMVEKNIAFVEKTFKEIDYTSVLVKISDALNRYREIQELLVGRDRSGNFEKLIPIYKK